MFNGQLEKSQKICLQILEKNSEDFDTLYLLGIINFQKKNYANSNKIFQKAIIINSNNAGFVLSRETVLTFNSS